MIIRWISDVPSKIVNILDYGAVSAGQRPAGGGGISTDSARAIRGWRRFRDLGTSGHPIMTSRCGAGRSSGC